MTVNEYELIRNFIKNFSSELTKLKEIHQSYSNTVSNVNNVAVSININNSKRTKLNNELSIKKQDLLKLTVTYLHLSIKYEIGVLKEFNNESNLIRNISDIQSQQTKIINQINSITNENNQLQSNKQSFLDNANKLFTSYKSGVNNLFVLINDRFTYKLLTKDEKEGLLNEMNNLTTTDTKVIQTINKLLNMIKSIKSGADSLMYSDLIFLDKMTYLDKVVYDCQEISYDLKNGVKKVTSTKYRRYIVYKDDSIYVVEKNGVDIKIVNNYHKKKLLLNYTKT